MSVREIVTAGHPALRQPAREVCAEELASREVQALIDDLIDTRAAADGAGLAANQIASSLRIAVVEVQADNPRYPYKPPVARTVLVNPTFAPEGEETILVNEGCLSVPGLRGEVVRHARVRVRYLDREGVAHEELRSGLTAGTFQHEVDHLDGILFFDRVQDLRTLMTWESYQRFHREDFERRAREIVARYGS
jgi:peptide deformylase